ncbi:hypothetical protein CR513_14666, partial [Mucuna pruriens]
MELSANLFLTWVRKTKETCTIATPFATPFGNTLKTKSSSINTNPTKNLVSKSKGPITKSKGSKSQKQNWIKVNEVCREMEKIGKEKLKRKTTKPTALNHIHDIEDFANGVPFEVAFLERGSVGRGNLDFPQYRFASAGHVSNLEAG